MKIEYTAEHVIQFGKAIAGTELEKEFIRTNLETLTPQERLEGLEPESVFSLYEPEAIEAYLAKIKRDSQH